ncbi:addiction module antidote protein [Pseudidiomarina aestuarii]|uniref:addiction module antidote protein n=1 Tax=Pseudidiomarina aestuarii TaxID=624146 RepID=UPI003A983839
MRVKLSRWEPEKYLDSHEAIHAYLEACIEESDGDPSFIIHALGVIARAKNMSQLSRDTGISREGLYKAFSENGNPTFATVAKVAKALGLNLTLEADSR